MDVTDDRNRVDVEQLLELYRTAWWAHDRSRDLVRRALDHSHPLLTVWDGPELVGFARVISDLTFRATIWDVIVRPSHQGRGIGTKLMHAVLDHPDLKTVNTFFLLTRDKHSFYEHLGFRHERRQVDDSSAMSRHAAVPRQTPPSRRRGAEWRV